MKNNISLNNVGVEDVYITQGNYEGIDYYRLVVKLDNGMTAKSKLTKFEYDTLIRQESSTED